MTAPAGVRTWLGGAEWWIDRGATLVRLRRQSKEPAGATWQTTTDPATLRLWWMDKDTSYGVICGVPLVGDEDHKLICFDHDAYKGGGDIDWPPTATFDTPSGGRHYFYRAPADLRLAAFDREHHVDVKGAAGRGYVVGLESQVRNRDGDLGYYRVVGRSVAAYRITDLPNSLAARYLFNTDDDTPEPPDSERVLPVGTGSTSPVVAEFNLTHTWADILEPHGWVFVQAGPRGEGQWRRPDKNRGISATTDARGTDTLLVFSTSTSFEVSPASYTKFAAWTVLTFNGDFKAAARSLHDQDNPPPPPEPPPSPAWDPHAGGAYDTEPVVHLNGQEPTVETLPPRAGPLSSTTTAADEWDPPLPLIRPALPLPTANLPGLLRDVVVHVANVTQTAPDLGFLTALCTITAATRGRGRVSPAIGWSEQSVIFAMAIADSGERKSPVRTHIAGALDALEATEQERGLSEYRRKRAWYELLQRKVARAEQKAASLNKDDPDEAEKAEKADRAYFELRTKFDNTPEPVELRLTADDVTPEKLGIVMAEQDGALAILSAEGGFLGTAGGRYAGGIANIDLILKAYTGEPAKVDRVGRASLYIPNPALTLGLVVQPDVAAELAANQTFVRRGLAARFLYAQPPSRMGRRRVDNADLDLDLIMRWHDHISLLYRTCWPRTFTLSSAAREKLREFQAGFEPRLKPHEGDLDEIRTWASKLPGQLLRVAMVFALADEPNAVEVDGATMDAALGLAEYFISHARLVLLGSTVNPAALAVDTWIKRGERKQFTTREAHQALRGRHACTYVEDVQAAVTALERASRVCLVPPQETQRGRPPSPTYQVNPDVLTEAVGVPPLSEIFEDEDAGRTQAAPTTHRDRDVVSVVQPAHRQASDLRRTPPGAHRPRPVTPSSKISQTRVTPTVTVTLRMRPATTPTKRRRSTPWSPEGWSSSSRPTPPPIAPAGSVARR